MADSTSSELKNKMAALLDNELITRARKRNQMSLSSRKVLNSESLNPHKAFCDTDDLNFLLRKDVLAVAAGALEITEDQLDPQENLNHFGVDSIAITEIMAQISRHFNVSIAPTTFFEAKHLNHLSEILLERYNKAIKSHYKKELSKTQKTISTTQDSMAATSDRQQDWLERHKKLSAEIDNDLRDALSESTKLPTPEPLNKSMMAIDFVNAKEPIAIIAMDGVFPKSSDTESLLENLKAGVDCIESVPESRWDWRSVDGDPKKGAFTPVKNGGFISDHDLFDAAFFNISPKEAELLDPQHRLFMMSVWRCIEKAGYAPSSLSGKKIAIFLGINLLDHVDAVNRAGIMEAQQMTGLGHAFCPNRLSFMLDIHGPSEVVDTACSSSLVALHRAVMSIHNENCEMAIVGGSNLMLSPKQHILFSKTGMLAADGRSKTFSSAADGYGRSDGVGCVLLKPLSRAEKDGDQILGVIKGTAEQHSGRSSSLTAPNSAAQARVILEAHRKSGVDPRAIGFIECHGTGTPLGDPAEVEGIKFAFSERFNDLGIEFPKEARIGLGSIKSNIGHTETCAGIAGLIKILLSLREKKLFKSLHCETINPLLKLEKTPFYILSSECRSWPKPTWEGSNTAPRAACISSFGAGGTNAHAVIEEYLPKQKRPVNPRWIAGHAVVPLSAKSDFALKKIATRLLDLSSYHDFVDVVYTLQLGRDAMRERLAFVAKDMKDFNEALADFLQGKDSPRVFRGKIKYSSGIKLDPSCNNAHDLAAAWVKGAEVDWSRCYKDGQPKRVYLPSYPFELKKFSLPLSSSGVDTKQPSNQFLSKPLMPRACGDNRFELDLSGTESFLKDHVIMGRKTLPGVAYLEMVQQCAAIFIKSPVVLHKIVWLKPMVVETHTLVSLDFTWQENNQWIASVYVHSKGEQEAIKHAEVRIQVKGSENERMINLNDVNEQTCKTYHLDSIYPIFDSMQLSYGPTHRTVSQIKCFGDQPSSRQLVAKLDLSDDHASALDQFILHPGLMDGAFQSVLGMALGEDGMPSQTALPFAIDSVEYLRPLKSEMWVHVRRSDSKWDERSSVQRYDIELFDCDGYVCVSFKGFTARIVASEKQLQETYVFRQKLTSLSFDDEFKNPIDKRHIITFEPLIMKLRRQVEAKSITFHNLGPLQPSAIEKTYRTICCKILEIIKEIVREPKLKHQILQVLLPSDAHLLPLTGIMGMLRTLRKEHPKLSSQLICLPFNYDNPVMADLDRAASVSGCLHLNLNQHGQLEKYEWDLRELPKTPGNSVRIENDKVYLITGGSGGISKLLTRYILDKAPRAHVVLTSRSAVALDKLDWLSDRERRQILFIPADIAKKSDVVRLIGAVKNRYQQIDGVFHAAGLLDDGALSSKSFESLKAVLAPKVDGISNLHEVLGDQKLDFMVLFSSIAAALGNAGQSDYAAANGFLDGFAQKREAERLDGLCYGKTLAIAWPLWRDGGMQISREASERMIKTTGLYPLDTRAAIARMLELLGDNTCYSLVLSGEKEKVCDFVMSSERDPLALTTPRKASLEAKASFDSLTGISSEKQDSRLSEALLQALKVIVSDVLKVEPHQLDDDEQLSEYGFDSIGFTQLANAINDFFDLELMPTLFFECPTLCELQEHFLNHDMEKIQKRLGIKVEDELQINKAYVGHTHVVRDNSFRFKEFKKGPIQDIQTESSTHSRDPSDSSVDDPIVIIGMSCLFPQANDTDAYWQNLLHNVDAISEIPPDRWDWRKYWGDPLKQAGRTNIKWGGFIEDVGAFDANFFGISSLEARYIDPQQRLLLQQVWRLFEDAGYAPGSFSGTDMGVFLGIADSAYSNIVAKDIEQIEGFTMAGLAPSLGPNRISYFYNLHGPSVAVETACSSALVAVHRAIEAIQAGRCSSAIAGGINLLLSPHTYVGFSKAGMLAADGRCKTFSATADGYARGEGLGLILLKRLSEAERDGDQIHAIIRASGENHGGFATSLTAPNPKAQAQLLCDVYRRSKIDPRTVSYIETHGTGTPMGDPIEVDALQAAFSSLHAEAESSFDSAVEAVSCGLGSVKSNIGHLEIAAGIAGLMKVVLQMKSATLVKSLHADVLNPYLKLDDKAFFIVDQNQPWKRVVDTHGRSLPYRAGVSSFGFGGSNAHVVLEEYISSSNTFETTEVRSKGNVYLMPLSARSKDQLSELVRQLKSYLNTSDDRLSNIAYTLQTAREAMEFRLAIICQTKDEFIDRLSAYLNDQHASGVFRSSVKDNIEIMAVFKKDAHFQNAAKASFSEGNFETLACLWVRGFEIDWQQMSQHQSCRKVRLPGYPFDQTVYWGTSTKAVSLAENAQVKVVNESVVFAGANFDAEHEVEIEKQDHLAPDNFQILEKLVQLAAEILEVDRSALDVNTELGDFGFDSIVMTSFAGRVNDKLDLDLSPADFFEFSTLNRLADHVATIADIRLEKESSSEALESELASETKRQAVADHEEGIKFEPIVVVGYSCHFPGARDADQFWQNLKAGKESICRVPAERWDWQAIDGDAKLEVGKTNVHWGGFCDGILEFDPTFFNISSREALLMDPQQRLLMTHVWKTLENAGHDPKTFAGEKLGIFAGTAASDYRQMIGHIGGDEAYVATGSVASVGPNRMSYFLDLRGPSEPIETACSSSLVALHRAVRSIQYGECQAAIAGGINTMLTPDGHINFSKAGMLSSDGHCKSFSKDANGYVRAEGVGFVFLKPLSAAKRDGNRILAVVKASGINHGGHANSLTAPNTNAQADLLRDTYKSAHINPSNIGYIEAHGTGTPLGDPVEINGLKSAFGTSMEGSEARTCYIGSVKTNIGHLELAAGIAGVIKTLLQIEHKTLVPSLHSSELNPHIKLEGSPFQINQVLRDWHNFKDHNGKTLPLLAGVSSFGFGGVNAHVVLEEYFDDEILPTPIYAGSDYVFVLSAKTKAALAERVQDLISALTRLDDKDIYHLAYTLQVGRTHMPCRLAIIANRLSELEDQLQSYLVGKRTRQMAEGQVPDLQLNQDKLQVLASFNVFDMANKWAEGQAIDWKSLYKSPARRLLLPSYPFSRDIYHIKDTKSPVGFEKKDAPLFDGYLDANAFYLKDHRVRGENILPGAMSLEVVRSLFPFSSQNSSLLFQNVSWLRAFTLNEGKVKPKISFKLANSGAYDFTFEDSKGIEAVPYMRGRICELDSCEARRSFDVNAALKGLLPADPANIYQKYSMLGINYGPSFQVIKALYGGEGKVLVHLALPDGSEHDGQFTLHPAILDGAFHAALQLFDDNPNASLALPIGVEQIELYQSLKSEMWAYLSIVSLDQGLIKIDINIADMQGRIAVMIKSFTLKTLGALKEIPRKTAVYRRQAEDKLEAYLKGLLSEFTDTPIEHIDPDAMLERYGMDSLLIGRMTQRLEEDFVDLPSTLFFDHPTLSSLAIYLKKTYPESQRIGSAKDTPSGKSATSVDTAIGSNDQSLETLHREDIAIIGLSGRYPQAENIDQFWQNLVTGKDCITEIPRARWDHQMLLRRAKDANLDIKSKWGGFIDNPDSFDPLFFNISPSEANYMDPQERVFMQCAWEAMEDAGYTRQTLAPMPLPLGGGNVGVFVGVMWQEYQLHGAERYANGDGKPIAMSSNGASVANRVSYFCNFHGPSIMLDTMCSSSLTAIHLAIQSIKSGSCSVALAGGVNLSTHPNKYIGLAQSNFLSSDGRCKSFGLDGDGYVPSEGVGAVILKPLSDAIADRDQIYGVIKGSEINHGGKVNGYTVPNPHAQVRVIQRALERAGVKADEVDYVEAHGTGTMLGDPIEVAALSRAFESELGHKPLSGRTKKCAIGSVKSNIGHAESAAGIAGMTKILLQFKFNTLVSSIHSNALNPKIHFENSPFEVQRETKQWPREKDSSAPKGRIAGLSSFGAGGSNAHFIVEDYEYCEDTLSYPGPYLVPFSAHDQSALRRLLAKFVDFSDSLKSTDLPSLSHTLQVGREAFEHRLVIIVSTVNELRELLTRVLSAPLDSIDDVRCIYNHVAKPLNLAEIHDQSDPKTLTNSIALDWAKGHNVEWAMLWPEVKPVKKSLPSYPFAKESYWVPGVTRSSNLKCKLPPKSNRALLYEPHWVSKNLRKIPSGQKVQSHVILCHLPNKHVQKIQTQLSDSKVYVWNNKIEDDVASAFTEYAISLLHLIKNLSKGKKHIHLIIHYEQTGAYFEALFGMLRSAILELKNLSGQLIAYDSASLDMLLLHLPYELSTTHMGGHIRYHENERFERSWRELKPDGKVSFPWKDKGVYLITGGAGGIGLQMAKHISQSVSRTCLWLVGRSLLSEDKQREIDGLDATVYYRQLDVASQSDMLQLIQEIRMRCGGLDGVIHSAGLTRDASIYTKSIEELEDVFSPKVNGLMALDQALGTMAVDFILLMSSVSGALGNIGQSDYAAANAFLDCFAYARNALVEKGQKKGRTLAVNWPYWQDGGMRLSESYVKAMAEDFGASPLEITAAFEALSAAFSYDKAEQVLVLSGDHQRLRSMMELQVIEAEPISTLNLQTSVAANINQPHAPTSGKPDRSTVRDLVVGAFVDVLGIESNRLDDDKPIDLYGVDSVSSLNILEPLKEYFSDLDLPQSLLFDYTSIKALVDYISQLYEDPRKKSDQLITSGAIKSPNDQAFDRKDGGHFGSSQWLDKTPKSWISPMGEGQKGIWIAQLMQPQSSVYNVPMAFHLRHIDEDHLLKACEMILDRYPILTTRVDDESRSEPLLKAEIIPEVLATVALSKDISASQFLKYRANLSFDLRKEAKIRFELLKGGELSESEAYFLVVAHHLVIDATSMAIIARQLWRVYHSLQRADENAAQAAFNESSLDYRHYISWETDYLESEAAKAALDYWKDKFDRDCEKLDLPFDLQCNPATVVKAEIQEFRLSRDLVSSAKHVARYMGVSTASFFMGVFSLLLHKYSGQKNFLIGIPTTRRPDRCFEETIGYCANMIPFLVDVDAYMATDAYLKAFHKMLLADLTHGKLPFSKIAPHMMALKDDKVPFQATCCYLNLGSSHEKTMDFNGSSVKLFSGLRQANDSLIGIDFFEYQQRFDAVFTYDGCRFSKGFIKTFMAHFKQVLKQIISEPKARINDQSLLSVKEKNSQFRWARVAGIASKPQYSVVDMVRKKAVASPKRRAVTCNGQTLSYHEMMRRVNRLSHYLMAEGVKPNDIVATIVERNSDSIITLLAVMSIGATWLPLDSDAPFSRNYAIVKNADIRLIVSHSSFKEALVGFSLKPSRIVFLDKIKSRLASMPEKDPNVDIDPNYAAYIIFTSGSTGEPKGVVIPYAAISQHTEVISELYNIQQNDSVLQFASHSTDTALEQILPTLASGARLVMLSDRILAPDDFLKLLEKQNVTIADIPPAYLNELLRYDKEWSFNLKLRLIILGGEALTPALISLWQTSRLARVKLLNAYGPTEATITALTYEIKPDQSYAGAAIPIGKPLPGVRAYILDDYGQLVPEGVKGELYLGGDRLATSYLNFDSLTKKCFVEKDLGDKPGRQRLYRTGDIVSYEKGASGKIVFHGRNDDQIKIRGYRVELGEIEAKIAEYDDCQVAVTLKTARHGEKLIIAHIVPGSCQFDKRGLKAHLNSHLPLHMIPNHFAYLDRMPVSSSGKIDRNTLKNLGRAVEKDALLSVPPKGKIEQKLMHIWRKVLDDKAENIKSVLVPFNDYGGNSLSAIRLMDETFKSLRVQCSYAELLAAPTIAQQAELVSQKLNKSSRAPSEIDSTLVPLRLAENTKCILFLLHPISGEVSCYKDLVSHLSEQISVYGIRVSQETRGVALRDMAKRYTDAIKSVQAKGPYHIAGWSFGGLLAYEIAGLLSSSGEKLAFIGMLDSYPYEIVHKMEEKGRGLSLFELFSRDILSPTHSIKGNLPDSLEGLARMLNQQGSPASMKLDDLKATYDSFVQCHRAFRAHKLSSHHLTLSIFQTKTKYKNQAVQRFRELSGSKKKVYSLPGDHYSFLNQKYLKDWVSWLNYELM